MTHVLQVIVSVLLVVIALPMGFVAAQSRDRLEYRVIATSKTSTMEKELNEAADAGFRYQAVMGGETAIGGKEVVAVLVRTEGSAPKYQYKLVASNRTSTMQKELQEAADAGFEYVGQTVFESLFGGKEVVCILQLDRENKQPIQYEYKLIATTRTSTLQREMQEAGDQGYALLGMTVAKTGIGGTELVAITRRTVR